MTGGLLFNYIFPFSNINVSTICPCSADSKLILIPTSNPTSFYRWIHWFFQHYESGSIWTANHQPVQYGYAADSCFKSRDTSSNASDVHWEWWIRTLHQYGISSLRLLKASSKQNRSGKAAAPPTRSGLVENGTYRDDHRQALPEAHANGSSVEKLMPKLSQADYFTEPSLEELAPKNVLNQATAAGRQASHTEGPRVDKYKEMLVKKAEEQGVEFISFGAAKRSGSSR
ncbi:hypothetical protein ZWY2020_033672 [Hordeum vulgare]|nr:hypothetical protein ZWY2020_033672 [Hordeum vulgare]